MNQNLKIFGMVLFLGVFFCCIFSCRKDIVAPLFFDDGDPGNLDEALTQRIEDDGTLDLPPPINRDQKNPPRITKPKRPITKTGKQEKILQSAEKYYADIINNNYHYSNQKWNKYIKQLNRISEPSQRVKDLIQEYNKIYENYHPDGQLKNNNS